MCLTRVSGVGSFRVRLCGRRNQRARIESYDSEATTKTDVTTNTHEEQSDTERGGAELDVSDDANAVEDRFGDESNAAVKYKTMEWYHVGLRMSSKP